MRMWLVKPKYLCRKHLLGEHVELHMLVGAINKGKNIDGFIKKRLVDPKRIMERHSLLVKEMLKRGYNHNSELPYHQTELEGNIDIEANIKELRNRCKECKKRIEELKQ